MATIVAASRMQVQVVSWVPHEDYDVLTYTNQPLDSLSYPLVASVVAGWLTGSRRPPCLPIP